MPRPMLNLSDADRTMVQLLVKKYRDHGWKAEIVEFDSEFKETTLGYRILSRSNIQYDFRFQKYKGTFLKALWLIMINAAESGERFQNLGYSSAIGLANALGEAEELMGDKVPPYNNLEAALKVLGI